MFTTNFVDAVKLVTDAVFPEDIFIQKKSSPKVVFRLLRSALHEDSAPADQKSLANDSFNRLYLAWEVAETLIADKSITAGRSPRFECRDLKLELQLSSVIFVLGAHVI